MMNGKEGVNRSHLFTLRVWMEEVGNGRVEIRGTLKHILSGEIHHFRDWQILVRYLETAFTTEQPHLEPDE